VITAQTTNFGVGGENENIFEITGIGITKEFLVHDRNGSPYVAHVSAQTSASESGCRSITVIRSTGDLEGR